MQSSSAVPIWMYLAGPGQEAYDQPAPPPLYNHSRFVCWLTNFLARFSFSGDTFVYWSPLIPVSPLATEKHHPMRRNSHNNSLFLYLSAMHSLLKSIVLTASVGRSTSSAATAAPLARLLWRANRIYISNNYIVPVWPNVSNCQFISPVPQPVTYNALYYTHILYAFLFAVSFSPRTYM